MSFSRLRAGSIAHSADSPPPSRSSPNNPAGTRSPLQSRDGPATTAPTAHSPATASSGAAPRGSKASIAGSTSRHRPRPASHGARQACLAVRGGRNRAAAAGAGVGPAGSAASGRFDLLGSLTIVLPLSQERGRRAPAFRRSKLRMALLGQQYPPWPTLSRNRGQGRGGT